MSSPWKNLDIVSLFHPQSPLFSNYNHPIRGCLSCMGVPQVNEHGCCWGRMGLNFWVLTTGEEVCRRARLVGGCGSWEHWRMRKRVCPFFWSPFPLPLSRGLTSCAKFTRTWQFHFIPRPSDGLLQYLHRRIGLPRALPPTALPACPLSRPRFI